MVDQRDAFFDATLVTTKEILIGFAASVAIGIPVAIAIDASRRLERRIYPLLLSSQVTPLIAFVPIIVMWFGFELKAKVIVVVLFTFFPIVLDTVAGLRSTDVEKLYLARSIGAGRAAILLKIKLPSALPNMFVGLKLAATLAVIGAVIAEFIGASEGLGTVLLAASANLDVATMLAGIGYLTLVGVLFFLVVDTMERIALPWHVSRRVHAATP
jgi:NitT/TauT family transport system permease protein